MELSIPDGGREMDVACSIACPSSSSAQYLLWVAVTALDAPQSWFSYSFSYSYHGRPTPHFSQAGDRDRVGRGDDLSDPPRSSDAR